jgi:hypothetical protein
MRRNASTNATRTALLTSTALLLTCVVVAAAAPASAAAAPTPAALNGVSCADGTHCVAVGTRVSGTYNKTLAKHWNGTAWAVAVTANPPGKTDAQLNSVSCDSDTSCIAVGNYSTKQWSRTLTEQWNGTSWNIVASPNPPGQTLATMASVTCSSSASCVAVGNYSTKQWSRTLIEQWNGTSWNIVASPNPPGQTYAALDGITCPSSTSCFAVGNDSTKQWSRTLVEHWNGTSWAIVSSPNPPGHSFAIVGSISCPGTTSCLAVGFFMTGASTKTLVEQWNGSRWSIAASPNPAPGLLEFAGLGAVACAGSADCYAVGFAVAGVGSRALIEHWNGTSWAIETSPSQSGGADFPALLGVACTTGTNCHAVGFSQNKTLIDRWDGTKWSIDMT